MCGIIEREVRLGGDFIAPDTFSVTPFSNSQQELNTFLQASPDINYR